MSDPTARALTLLSLLQTHRHWKGSELADRLGVTERTVRRDIDRLRELGYPVDAAAGVDGGYRLAVGSHIPPLLLDDEEAVALVIGLQRAAVSAIDGIEQSTLQLVAKLDQILPDRLRRQVDALRSSVEVMAWTPSDEPVPAASLTVLSLACRDHEEVRFDYRRRDGEDSRRLVQPHQLVSAGRRWYLVAWDVRREDWRTFRLDRMGAPALAGARFDPRPLPAADASSFVAEGMRSMATEHRATVRVDATPDALDGLSRWLGATQTVVEGWTRLDLRSDSLDWLASMVLIIASRFDVAALDAPQQVHDTLAAASSRVAAVTGPRRLHRNDQKPRAQPSVALPATRRRQ